MDSSHSPERKVKTTLGFGFEAFGRVLEVRRECSDEISHLQRRSSWAIFRRSMTNPYEEILRGESLLRHGPGMRHELIAGRLHALVSRSAATLSTARVLPPRSVIEICPG